MSNKTKYILLALATLAIVFFIGRKIGSNDGKVSVVNNIAIIKEIAEVSSLEVGGNSNIKATNRSDDGSIFGQLSNLFTENTLDITVPYHAKFGVNIANQNIDINTNNKTVVVHLPKTEMLSLQMRLDSVKSSSQQGILSTLTLDQVMKVQTKLYNETKASIENNPQYHQMAQNHIQSILQRYYGPMGYTVKVEFGDKPNLQ